jgi:hypothetical protein
MSSLFAPKMPPAPPPPAPRPVATMPDPDSADVIEARRRAQTDILRRAGRGSTILTAPENRGSDYSSRTLG